MFVTFVCLWVLWLDQAPAKLLKTSYQGLLPDFSHRRRIRDIAADSVPSSSDSGLLEMASVVSATATATASTSPGPNVPPDAALERLYTGVRGPSRSSPGKSNTLPLPTQANNALPTNVEGTPALDLGSSVSRAQATGSADIETQVIRAAISSDPQVVSGLLESEDGKDEESRIAKAKLTAQAKLMGISHPEELADKILHNVVLERAAKELAQKGVRECPLLKCN